MYCSNSLQKICCYDCFHLLIHHSIDNVVHAGNKLLSLGLASENSNLIDDLGKYKVINDKFDTLLKSHLNDEEDLLIPLVNKYGEEYFGLGH